VEHSANLQRLASGILTDDVLQAIHRRAPGYDADNAFFHEDLEQLKSIGYLGPRPLSQMVADQRLLARHAPATALGVGMHLTWVGVAQTLASAGDSSLQWVLDDATAGEVFSFGVSEAGNDRVLTDSITDVVATDEGYRYTGTKIFTSLSPVWTRMSVLGRHGDNIIHGFISRDQDGWSNTPDWDTLGMRATQSYTTRLDKVLVTPDRVARILPVGHSSDPFIGAIFQNFLCLISAVYVGIADRALELAITRVGQRTSLARDGQSLSEDPDIRWQVAEMGLRLDSLDAPLHQMAADVDNQVDHGPRWPALLSGLKHRSVETARWLVDRALRISGGRAYQADSEISRLQRDVLAGVYHPSDTEAVHATIAYWLLGDPKEQANK
jgi:alkylation response protein AidB-like acyl-CoA dehydrogenase